VLRAPEGCHFRPRCPHAFDKCVEVPELEQRQPDVPTSRDRCWLPVQDKKRLRVVGDRIGLTAPPEPVQS
jgi:peptide/nickel transport system ATP-binding protein/oligopeptide transport system ATP-binding protein